MINKKITLNTIVNALEDISIQNREIYPDHFNIKSFGYGPASDAEQLEINGVLMFVEQGEMEIEDQITRYSFSINIIDLLNNDNSNLQDIMSDTAQICEDIIKRMRKRDFEQEYGFKPQNIVVGLPGMNLQSQSVAGWRIDVTFEVWNGTLCDTAFKKDPVPVPETLHYIASTSDIIGPDCEITITASEDKPTGTRYVTSSQLKWGVGDLLYIGYSSQIAERTIEDAVTYADSNRKLYITAPDAKVRGFNRIAKLTSFTTATYTNIDVQFNQKNWITIEWNGDYVDLDGGDIIRITNSLGEVYYDIISYITWKSGSGSLTTWMGKFGTLGTSLTIDKMTNIV